MNPKTIMVASVVAFGLTGCSADDGPAQPAAESPAPATDAAQTVVLRVEGMS